MVDDLEPANQNFSFRSLTQNPWRQHANDQLARILLDFESDGVPPSILADLLFEYLLIEIEPDEPIDVERAFTWYSQLNRFRDRLQSQIHDIHQVYEDIHD